MSQTLRRVLAVGVIVLGSTAAYADLGDQLFKLLPDDADDNDNDRFGSSVSISGTIAIVGARYDRPTGSATFTCSRWHDSGEADGFPLARGSRH